VSDGDLDLLLIDTWVHHVEAVWDFPDFAGSEIGFEDRSERELKGVPGMWHLYSAALTDHRRFISDRHGPLGSARRHPSTPGYPDPMSYLCIRPGLGPRAMADFARPPRYVQSDGSNDLALGWVSDSFGELSDSIADFGFADVPEAEH
jgi:hypothetical protein